MEAGELHMMVGPNRCCAGFGRSQKGVLVEAWFESQTGWEDLKGQHWISERKNG